MLTIPAPAKLNLTLEVLGKRPDGYHEIRTVMQKISLCDTFTFTEASDIVFSSNLPGWVAEQSLVSRAVALIKRAAGGDKGAKIRVDKRIPLLSGLGGDSSDAVAVLEGLARLWKLGLTGEELHKLAEQLGSDVPFFLYGGTALAEGRGEKITPLPPLPHTWVILIMPSVPRQPGKTAQLYRSLSSSHFTDGRITDHFIKGLKEGKFDLPDVFNTFEKVVFAMFPDLEEYRKHLLKVGAANIHLAGSGPALFSLVKEKDHAEDLFRRIKQQNMETYLAETL